MALLEDNTQVFIIRIWFEGRDLENGPVEWRGVIEHVPTKQRRYVKNLIEIIAFIGPYLDKVVGEVKPRQYWRLKLKQIFGKGWGE
jgi:hypothetical protein